MACERCGAGKHARVQMPSDNRCGRELTSSSELSDPSLPTARALALVLPAAAHRDADDCDRGTDLLDHVAAALAAVLPVNLALKVVASGNSAGFLLGEVAGLAAEASVRVGVMLMLCFRRLIKLFTVGGSWISGGSGLREIELRGEDVERGAAGGGLLSASSGAGTADSVGGAGGGIGVETATSAAGGAAASLDGGVVLLLELARGVKRFIAEL
jgi:hypothetical protein